MTKGRFDYIKDAVASISLAVKPPRTKAVSGTGYEAATASRTRRMIGILAGLIASADRHLTKMNLGKMREICRAHDRQSCLFSGILDRALDNIVGANFDFIPTTGDKELNKKVKDFIKGRMTSEICDATGVRAFDDILKTSIRSIWNDGDILLVKRPDGSLLPFEAEQVEASRTTSNSGKRIVLGVELNDVNRIAAYHVKQRRTSGDSGMSKSDTVSRRVPANLAMMPAYRKRFNQTRGVPFLAAILGMFDRTNNYMEFESLAAELNAMGGFKITREATENDLPGVSDNEDSSTNSTFDKLQKFEPGWIFEGLPGEDIKMVSPERPGGNFEPYIVICCRIIGVGVGYPLELLMLDFSRTNYSSARASMGEARRMFRGWQKFAQENICMPWYRWQISRAIASGLLPAKAELFSARCQWPAWEYIDPFKAAKGNEIAIKTRTKSISQCIRETGGEPDEIFEEIAADNAKLAELGITIIDAAAKPAVKDPDEEEIEKLESEETNE